MKPELLLELSDLFHAEACAVSRAGRYVGPAEVEANRLGDVSEELRRRAWLALMKEAETC